MKVYFLSFNIMKNSTADYFIALCNKLAEENQVVIITSKIRDSNLPIYPSIKIYKWPTSHPNTWKDFMFICKKVNDYKPDVMISMFSAVNLFLIAGKRYGVTHRIAWIRSLSTQFKQRKLHVWRRSLIYRLATVILVNSEATKKDASQFYHIAHSKIRVLPNSVKDYSNTVQNVPISPSKIVYVGRLHASKGIEVLINSFAILLSKGYDLQLDIIGNGGILNDLIRLTQTKAIEERVSFLGVKSKEAVLEAFKSAYCAVVPSYFEAFGFTVIEAMSVGTCVIGANNTGIKEIIHHAETGLLFETGNSMDLALQLESVLTNENLRNRLAQAGYNRFRANYDSQFAINRDVEFLKQLK